MAERPRMTTHAAGARGPDALTATLSGCRRDFWLVALFSGVANLLRLTVSIYMLQLLDRVYATRRGDTLWLLTLIAVAALLFLITLATERFTAPMLRDAAARQAIAQRRAEATARNAEVIDSMGMARPLLASWQTALEEAAEPARRAADRAAILLAMGRGARRHAARLLHA